MKYGIIGSGSANTKVVQEGLIDILKSDEDAIFVIHARRAPQGAVSDVYDFLVDHKVPFSAVTRIDDKAPQGLLNFALEVVTNDDPTKTIINVCDEVLLLWDESSEEASEKLAIMSADAGKPIKDLTMALTPIVIEGSPEPVNMDVIEPEIVYEKPVAHDPDETTEGTPFTRDELMNMNIGVLRRQAKALGVENIGKTKQEIVDAIFYHEPVDDDDAPVVSADIVATEIVEPLNVTQGQLTWIEDGVLQSVMLGENFTKRFLADLRYKPI
jgi:hypothetical protein